MWNNVESYRSENMTRKGLSMGFAIFIVSTITLFFISPCSPTISDKRLCYNPECSEPVALAKTVSKYISNDPQILSFDVNVDVKVFSKSAGRRSDLWGVEIAGKRGYAPRSFLREKKVLHKVLEFEVPTEKLNYTTAETDPPKSEDVINSNTLDTLPIVNTTVSEDGPIVSESFENSGAQQVSPSFEVFEGTTIAYPQKDEPNPDESYATKIIQSPPLTEQPILTVHPNLVASETPLQEDSRPDTESLPSGIGHESIIPHSIVEDVSSSPIENSQPSVTPESSISSEDEVPNITEKEDSLVPIAEELENKSEVLKKNPVDELSNLESAKASTEEKIDTAAPSVLSTDETVQMVDDKAIIPPSEELEPVEEAPQVPQKTESTTETPSEISVDGNTNEISQEVQQDAIVETSNPTQQEVVQESPLITQPDIVKESFLNQQQDPEFVEEISSDLQAQNVNETYQIIDEKSVEETPQIIQDEIPKLDNQKIENEVVESNLLADTFETVASIFNVLSTTIAPETSEETEKVLEPTIEHQTNTVESESQDDNKDETSSTSPLNDSVNEIESQIEHTNEIDQVEVIKNDSIITEVNTSEDIKVDADEEILLQPGQPDINQEDELAGSSPNVLIDQASNFNEFPANRNLLNVGGGLLDERKFTDKAEKSINDQHDSPISEEITIPTDSVEASTSAPESIDETSVEKEDLTIETAVETDDHVILPPDVCHIDNSCDNSLSTDNILESSFDEDDTEAIQAFLKGQNHWQTFSYLALTAVTTLIFSLGYYYIENSRRDGQLIAKINKLEKELLISSKECTVLDETLKSTTNKLNSIADESLGSNETVASLKEELENANKSKQELEGLVAVLEKDLESATEAGLELERMLRELLTSKNTENPLAKSVEELQTRLAAQQSVNESLTNTLHLKTQEHEALSNELAVTTQKCEQLEVEISRINDELKLVKDGKNTIVQNLTQQIEQYEKQIKDISAEKITLRKQLKGREMEIKDLLEVVKQANINNFDFDKLADISHVKAEAYQLTEERDELKMKLSELEGAHNLLQEHMKIINEEVVSLSEQCKVAEKEKNEAVTRLEVLSKFFKEKEDERQKEEAVWLKQQGEVSTTVDRLHSLQNEIQSYKQQMETLKREILDQEREYKAQMTALESKAHEQWVLARQSERRLEESKAEAGQLRNRLTLIEKNLSDTEPDHKNHRLEANGETATSPQLFMGAEASNSPIMFGGSSNMPPPYLPYGPPLPPFLPPHMHTSPAMPPGYDVGQRPPPLGGRLSSPPPIPSSAPPLPHPSARHSSTGGRYDRLDSSPPPPPISPSMLPPYGHYRQPSPPSLPFHNDRIHPPPPVPLLPPGHLSHPPWGEGKLPPRNNGSFHPFHRDQRARDYKGSLESSVESLDKTHHSGKV